MSSDFVSVLDGMLSYNDEVWDEIKNEEPHKKAEEELGEFKARYAGRLMKHSKDGYYNNKVCLQDFKKAIDVIKKNHDGKLTPVFLTDHSPIHKMMPEDGLAANKMNLSKGGKQRKMRPGYYYTTGPDGQRQKIVQPMVFQDGPDEGLAKGLRVVCTERFGSEAVEGKNHKDLVDMLAKEEDFKAQETVLEEVVRQNGGMVIWGVKFHPELSAIESCYCDISRILRQTNTPGCSRGFEQRYINAIKGVKLSHVRKYFLSCSRYLSAYQDPDATGESVMAKMKKQKKRHRAPPQDCDEPVRKSNRQYRNRQWQYVQEEVPGPSGDVGDQVEDMEDTEELLLIE